MNIEWIGLGFIVAGGVALLYVSWRMGRQNIAACKKCKYREHEACMNMDVANMIYSPDDRGGSLVIVKGFSCAYFEGRMLEYKYRKLNRLKAKIKQIEAAKG